MKEFVWRDRLVKLEEGNFMMSAKGKHYNFDFMPRRTNPGQAVAGNPGEPILDMEVMDHERLLLHCASDDYVLTGVDDVFKDMRITPVRKERKPMNDFA